VLAFILFSSISTQWVSLTFLPFTVLKYFPTTELHLIGLYSWMYSTGIASGHLCSTFVWAFLTDKLGRRVSIIVCLLGITSAICLLGFSPSFYFTILAQFFLGLFNGINGIVRSYTIRTSDDGLTSNGIVNGLGLGIGILVGGYLSTPSNFLPITEGSVFRLYPFALPCITVSFFNLFAIGFTLYELNDHYKIRKIPSASGSIGNTEYIHLRTDEDDAEDDNSSSSDLSKRRILTEILTEAETSQTEMDETEHDSETETAATISQSILPDGTIHITATDDIESPSDITRDTSGSMSSVKSDKSNASTDSLKRVSFNSLVEVRVIGSQSHAYSKLKKVKPDDTPLEVGTSSRYTNGSEFFHNDDSIEPPLESVRRLLLKDNVFLVICINTLMNTISCLIMDLLMLWIITEREHGGLQLEPQQCALFISLSLSIALIYQTSRFADTVKEVGLIKVYRNSALLVMISAWLLPSPLVLGVNMKPRTETGICMMLFIVMSVGTVCGSSSARVLLMNSVYSHQQNIVTKIVDFFQAILYAVTAFIAYNLYAWSATTELKWPLNFPLVWYLIGLLSMYNHRLSSRLPRNMNRCRREPVEPRYAVTMIKSKLDDYFDGFSSGSTIDTSIDVSLNGSDEMSRLMKR